MESIPQFQRYEAMYRSLSSEFNAIKEELNETKNDYEAVVEENKKLRRDLKDSIANQLSPSDLDLGKNFLNKSSETDKSIVHNLEKQLELMKKEREGAMQMWQNSLLIIAKLEQDLKTLQFQTAPQTMSFELELKKRQEEFGRMEAGYLKEISILRAEANQKEDDLMDSKMKQNELKLLVENLNSQLGQKDQERRNMIKKEYGYDDALLSLQNDINDLETKVLTLNKDNQHLKESLRETNKKLNEQSRLNAELDRVNQEIKAKNQENLHSINRVNTEKQKTELIDQKYKEENERLQDAIALLMDEATLKTKQEVETLRKLYNANIEKLIDECNFLETDRNNKANQLEKCLRTKKTLEQEIEMITNENLRSNFKENNTVEDLHKRLCVIERDKEQALIRLEARENELKKLRNLQENDREQNQKIISDFSEKSAKAARDLERLSEEHAKLINQTDSLNNKLYLLQAEKDALQKQLTKQIQLHESEIQLKTTDSFNKIKCLEENHARSVFELRQLLNMQQRMSNKWKEECQTVTNQSEAKFLEMKKNFENIRKNNEKMYGELQDSKRKEHEFEIKSNVYVNKIKALEARVKDAEHQATECTKKIAKQLAREKMIEYEKHLLESDLEKNNFNDVFSRGKVFMQNMNTNEAPIKEKMNESNEDSDD